MEPIERAEALLQRLAAPEADDRSFADFFAEVFRARSEEEGLVIASRLWESVIRGTRDEYEGRPMPMRALTFSLFLTSFRMGYEYRKGEEFGEMMEGLG